MDEVYLSDDDAPRKKKKKKTKAAVAAPQKIGGLLPRKFGNHLAPFKRILWQTDDDDSPPSPSTVAATRQRLGLRVPDVRRLPCKFWQRGTCARGAACSFAHSEEADAPSCSAASCPPPIESLSDPGLPRCVGRAMLHLGHRTPSSIQAQAWPCALKGHDLLCKAPTGSGKTLAYVLPATAHALAAPSAPSGGGPIALVLVPTRELAQQVLGVCRALKRPCGLKCEALYGGEPRVEQVETMEQSKGLHLLVATTGRLVDLLMTKEVRLDFVTMLILDEADQLLTLGFSLQVTQILSQLRPDRQTLLFSATLSPRLEGAAGSWLNGPMRVYAEERSNSGAQQPPADDDVVEDDNEEEAGGSDGEDEAAAADTSLLSKIPSSVEQRFVLCTAEEGGRSAALLRLLAELGHALSVDAAVEALASGGAAAGSGSGSSVAGQARNPPRVMVFVNEIKQIKKLLSRLKGSGLKCEGLHGEKSQREREEALRLFKAGAAPVLLTSDLGARGLDIAKLPCVVNFDPPPNAAQYVHRCGRTGRQGNKGLCVTLLRRDKPSRHLARQLSKGALAADEALRELLPAAAPAPAKKKKRPRSSSVDDEDDLMAFAMAATS